jgi:hypothetical protein
MNSGALQSGRQQAVFRATCSSLAGLTLLSSRNAVAMCEWERHGRNVIKPSLAAGVKVMSECPNHSQPGELLLNCALRKNPFRVLVASQREHGDGAGGDAHKIISVFESLGPLV